jgi:hypothetical protein
LPLITAGGLPPVPVVASLLSMMAISTNAQG